MSLHSLEKTVFNEIIRAKIKNKKFLLAVSGGADSIALLGIFKNLRTVAKLQFRVAHVFHGDRARKKIKANEFRFQAEKLVIEYCKKNRIEYVTNLEKYSGASTEESWREFRYEYFDKIIRDDEVLVLAHHEDDLLETRMFRLIRGVGYEGLEAMSVYANHRFRPLLHSSKALILAYLKKQKMKFLEDPSNRSNKFFRNWLRNRWFVELEKKRPGSLESLSRSLAHLVKAEPFLFDEYVSEEYIHRTRLLELDLEHKRRVFAYYLHKIGAKNYTQAHIDEILKRLDTGQKILTFKVCQCVWSVDAQYIRASLAV